MKRLVISCTIVALTGAFAVWWFSPGRILKRRTLSLLESLTMDSGTKRSARQMGVYSLNALLASEVELNTPAIEQANGTFERSELESAFSWLCDQAKQTRFELDEFDSVTVTGDVGEVAFSLEALVELPAYRPADGHYQVTFQWRREDDVWRLERATWLEVKR